MKMTRTPDHVIYVYDVDPEQDPIVREDADGRRVAVTMVKAWLNNDGHPSYIETYGRACRKNSATPLKNSVTQRVFLSSEQRAGLCRLLGIPVA